MVSVFFSKDFAYGERGMTRNFLIFSLFCSFQGLLLNFNFYTFTIDFAKRGILFNHIFD